MYKVGFREEAVMKLFEGRIWKGQKTTFFIRPTKKVAKSIVCFYPTSNTKLLSTETNWL